MVGFYGRFIPQISRIAEPLHALKRKNANFVWGDAQQAAFCQLKEALGTPPVLQIPDFSKELTLICCTHSLNFLLVLCICLQHDFL
jgi:hypothetical protein